MITVIVVGIVVLALVNFAFKAAGPALLMDVEPSPTVQELIISLSPALLTGLVVVELAGPRWAELDWTAVAALAAAAVAYRLRVPDLLGPDRRRPGLGLAGGGLNALLTTFIVNSRVGQVLDVEVIETPAAAAAALDPVRSRILAALTEPGSATTVARTLGLPRQKVNYHLRSLESQGLVTVVAVRARRGLTERMLQATAASYVVSPAALGEAAATPDRADRLSSRYLIALAARMVREVATLARRAEAAGRPLATLAIDTEIRFASAGQRAAFTRDLAEAVTALAAHYHDESSADGRWHRLVVAAHPSLEHRGAARPDDLPAPAASPATDPTEEI